MDGALFSSPSWFYIDNLGYECGPFRPEEMWKWYNSGYLLDDLMVRRTVQSTYTRFASLALGNAVQPMVKVEVKEEYIETETKDDFIEPKVKSEFIKSELKRGKPSRRPSRSHEYSPFSDSRDHWRSHENGTSRERTPNESNARSITPENRKSMMSPRSKRRDSALEDGHKASPKSKKYRDHKESRKCSFTYTRSASREPSPGYPELGHRWGRRTPSSSKGWKTPPSPKGRRTPPSPKYSHRRSRSKSPPRSADVAITQWIQENKMQDTTLFAEMRKKKHLRVKLDAIVSRRQSQDQACPSNASQSGQA